MGISGDRLPAVVASKVLFDAFPNEEELPSVDEQASGNIVWKNNRVWGYNVPFIRRTEGRMARRAPDKKAPADGVAIRSYSKEAYENSLALADHFYKLNEFEKAAGLYEVAISNSATVLKQTIRQYRFSQFQVGRAAECDKFLKGALAKKRVVQEYW